MPLWLAAPITAIWLTWYGSLQHEIIHGHPTSWRRLNNALASLPLALWLPYRIYRTTHLKHHRHGGERLTEVGEDPETFYVSAGTLERYGSLRRLLSRVNCTLLGRLTLGPAICLYRFYSIEIRKLLAGDRARAVFWARHLFASILVLTWIGWICRISLANYLFLVVYPSISLTLLRSFGEHRASSDPSSRTAVVESRGFWSLLFLNNNLHIAHHAQPHLPWYRLPEAWQAMRDGVSKDLIFERGYSQVAWRYLLRPVISVEHPGSGYDSQPEAAS